MKLAVTILFAGLLAGCTSKEPINGIYEVDEKYSATHLVQALNESMPDEVAIKKWEQSIINEAATVTIEYPDLRFTRKKPTPIDDSLRIRKIDETQFILLTQLEDPKEVTLTYNPTEQSILWGTYKYIKR